MKTPVAMTTDEMVDSYGEELFSALLLLFENKLHGQMMILIFSAVDALGLLDAPPEQTEASGASFKAWVGKYMLSKIPNAEFSEVDFWAARCGVLHTHTSLSKLSKEGKARQIQYFSGPKSSPFATAFYEAVRDIDGGAHVPANLEDVLMGLIKGFEIFKNDLKKKCADSDVYNARLRNILQSQKI